MPVENLTPEEKAIDLVRSYEHNVNQNFTKGLYSEDSVYHAHTIADEMIKGYKPHKIFGEIDYWNDVKRALDKIKTV